MKALIIPILLALTGLQSNPIDDQTDYAQKIKTNLEQVYSDREFSIGPLTVSEEGNLIQVSGKGELQRQDINLSAQFNKSADLLSILADFPQSKKMNKRTFKRFSKGPSLDQWFPKAIQKNLKVSSIGFEFHPKDAGKDSRLKAMQLNIKSTSSWKFFGNEQVGLKDVTGKLIIEDPNGKRVSSAQLFGNLKMGNTTFAVSAQRNKSGEDWILTGKLAKLNLGRLLSGIQSGPFNLNMEMPISMDQIEINNATFSAYPNRKTFSLSGISSIGKTELWITPKERSKDLMYLVSFAPDPSFSYASLTASLQVIDRLNLANSGLVLASDAGANTDLEVFRRLGGSTRLNRGLNVIGKYNLKGIGLDDLLGLETLLVRGVLSNRPADMLLEANINTNISFGKGATFKRLIFGLKPDPQKMEVSLGGEMELKVGEDLLLFNAKAGIDVADQALFIEGTMDGDWKNPLGVNGMQLSDMWLRVGASFRTVPVPLPELGIAGKLKAGELEGDMMVFLNLNNPSEAALDAGFNKITVGQVMRAFCDPKIEKQLSPDMNNLVNSIYLEDTRLTVVPKPMLINNTNYDAGFRVKGKGAVNGVGAMLDLNIDYQNGIQAKAASDPILLDPYFRLTGAAGSKNPYLDIDLRANRTPRVAMNGTGTVLGLTAATDVQFSGTGFSLMLQGKVFDTFGAKVQLSGSSFGDSNGAGFFAAVTLEQDFLEYFTKYASQRIDESTQKTQQDFRAAQKVVAAQKKELQKINYNIRARRAAVKKERDANIKKWNAAADKVATARTSLDAIDTKIAGANKSIKAAKDRIKAKEKWIKEVKEPARTGRRLGAAAFFTEQNGIIALKYGEIATQKGYQETARLTLKAAEGGLRGITPIHELPPVDSDPELIALFTARDGATALLDGASLAMKVGEGITVGGLKATKWIVENGPGKVANITYAHFEGGLSWVNGGKVKLRVKGKFADGPFDETIAFDFTNPLVGVQDFADKLLK